MAYFYEGFRYDITSAAAYTGSDPRIVPKAGTLTLYRKGATLTAPGSGGPGNVAMPISNPGTLVPGDTVKIGTGSVGGTVQVGGYGLTSLIVAWSSSVSWAAGDRLIVTTGGSQPLGYSEPFLQTSLTSTISFGATTGLASFYCREPEIDIIRTINAVSDVLPDQAGASRPESSTPLVAGMKADGTTNDAAALSNLTTRALLAGRGVIDLPPGDIVIDTGVNLAGISGLKIRGQGAGVTRLLCTQGGVTPFAISSSTDVTFEDLSFVRTGVGTVPFVTNGAGCQRVKFKNVTFTRCFVAVFDAGTDTGYDGVYADGADWSTVVWLVGAARPKIKDFTARIGASLGATNAVITIDTGTVSPRLDQLDIAPSDLASYTGSALKITGAVHPQDVLVTNSKLVGGDKAGTERAAVLILAGRGLRFTGVTCEDSLYGYHINGDIFDIGWSACTNVGIAKDGIKVTADWAVLQIAGLVSSDIGQLAANTYAHVSLLPTGLGSDWHTIIDALTYGNMIRGGATTAKYVLEANQFVDLTGVDGIGGNLATIGTSVLALAAAIDLGAAVTHVDEVGLTTRRHEAVAWPVQSTASTTPTVTRRKAMRITAAITITNFLGGRDGQTITIWNASGGTVVIDCTGTTLISQSGADISMANGQGRTFEYDATSVVWREV